MAPSDRRVLVTGAGGFLGRHVCAALQSTREVFAMMRRTPAGEGPAGVAVPCDLENAETVRRVFAAVRPAVAIHLAGLVTTRSDGELVGPMFSGNAASAVHVLGAARESGCRRVVLVSSSVAREAELGLARSPYAVSKFVAEAYGRLFAHLYDLEVVCLRPFMTYGPGQNRSKLVAALIIAALTGRQMAVSHGQRCFDLLYVDDAVRAILLAIDAPRQVADGRPIDIGTGTPTALRDLVDQISRLTGASSPATFAAAADAADGDHVADPSRAERELGWKAEWTLDAGLRQTVRTWRARFETGALVD